MAIGHWSLIKRDDGSTMYLRFEREVEGLGVSDLLALHHRAIGQVSFASRFQVPSNFRNVAFRWMFCIKLNRYRYAYECILYMVTYTCIPMLHTLERTSGTLNTLYFRVIENSKLTYLTPFLRRD